MKRLQTLLSLALLLTTGFVWADIPRYINFQGRLLDANGVAVSTSKSVIFRLYDAETGGTAVFSETQSVAPDLQGIYNVFIGSTVPLGGVDFNQSLWLELTIEGEVLTPRYRLTTSPYALRASTANAVAWSNIVGTPAGFADGTDDGGMSIELSDSVIVTTATTLDFSGTVFDVNASPAGEANVQLNPSSVTLKGNTFNAADSLVQLDGSGRLPALDGSQLTNVMSAADSVGSGTIIDSTITLTELNLASIDTRYVTTGTAQTISGIKTITADWINTANPWADDEIADDITITSAGSIEAAAIKTGTIVNARLDSSSVTLQGNAFNNADQLVKLDSTGRLPAIDGSQLTNIGTGGLSGDSVGTTQIIDSTVALVDINTASIDTRYLTTGTAQTITGIKTISADWVNTANPWADDEVSNTLTIASAGSVDAGAINSGTLPNDRIDDSSVTLQGNTFNSANQLVQLDGSGDLQVGAAAASTMSASGHVTLANLGSAPGAQAGRIYFDSSGQGALKVSLDGSTFVSLATGTAGAGLAEVASDSDQFSGKGTATDSLELKSSSVTLQGNTFNGADQLVKLDGSGNVPALNGSALTDLNASNLASGTVPNDQIDDSSVTLQGNTFNSANQLVKLDGSGDLQVGAATASTVSASGHVTLANLGSAPGAQVGRIYFDSSGQGALKVSLDGSSFVSLATGTAGAGLAEVASDSDQFSGKGTATDTLELRSSSVTLQGNTFNGADQLVKLDGSGNVPALNGSALTDLNASNLASGTVPNDQIDDSSVTLQGNTFNSANQLVKLDGSGDVPADSVGSSQITDASIAIGDLDSSSIDTRYLTTGTAQTITGIKTISADWVNTANPWADDEVSNTLTIASAGSIDAGAIKSGTLPNDRIDDSSVTLQGNTFNGANQLVQLDGSGDLQVGAATASTVSASGHVTLANLGSAPGAQVGRIYFDSSGQGALKVSLDGSSFVSLATGTAGAGLAEVASDSDQFSGKGTATDALELKSSSVTLQGNTFNGADQLVKLDGSGNVPALNGFALTDLNASNLASGTIPNERIDDSSVTLQGNTFNNANQLVKLDGSGDVPADSVGSSQITDASISIDDLDSSSIDTRYLTTGTAQTITGIKTISADWVNTANPWADDEVSNTLTIASVGSVDAGAIKSGTLPNDRIDDSSVTLQGNTFNEANQLVQLDGSGDLQVGAATASTMSASGHVTLANLGSAPGAQAGRIYFDSTGQGALKVSLDGSSFVSLATGTAGAGLAEVASDSAQFSGKGTATDSLELKSSSVTLQGNTFNGADQLVKLDGSGNIPALNGSALTDLNASNLASGTVPNDRIDDSSVTMLGNAFNGASQLIQLDGSGNVPALNGSALTDLNAGNLASGTVPNDRIDDSSVTLQGNTFNSANQLVKLDGSGDVPADSVGSSQITDGSIAIDDLDSSSIDTRYLTTGTAQTITGIKTISADWVNTANPWADDEVSNTLTIASAGSVDAGAIKSGTLPNDRIDDSSVTLQGNAFNGASQLVQLDGSGDLQVGAATASTMSASGHVTLANLGSAPGAQAGRIYFDSTGQGALKVSLDGSSFVSLATGTAGAGLAEVASDSAQFSGKGTATDALELKSSSVTLQGNTFNGIDQLVKLDGSGDLPALNASALTSLDAGNLASGTVPNDRIDDSSVTMLGNTFNGASQLIQLDGSGNIPALNGSALTDLNASNLASGTVPNARIDDSSVTLQGNTFNSANQLVKLDGSGDIPSDSVGAAQITDGSIAVADLDSSSIDTRYLTTGTAQTIAGIKTISADWVNTTNPWADDEVSNTLTIASAGSVDAGAIKSGTLPNDRIDNSSVTMQGNAFNGANQLVKLDGSGDLQVGAATASTMSASGHVTLANLGSAPGAQAGRIYFDSTGQGALKVSLDGSSFVSLATGTAGAGLAEVSSDSDQFSGKGTATDALELKSSSVTLQGNTFNGADQLVKLDGSGNIPALNGSALTDLNASNLASGTVPNDRIDDSSVTMLGNTFNGANLLIKLDGSGDVPALNGSALTDLNASNLASGTVPNARIDDSSVTLQGNTFNSANQLVKLDGSGDLPSDSVGAAQITDGSIAVADLDSSSIDTRYLTTGTAQTITGAKTISADWVNTANPWADDEVSNTLTIASAGSVDAGAIKSGTLPNDRIDDSSVTMQGNAFNGASQLVQLDGSGDLPALNGSALTDLNASNLASGTVPNDRIDDSSVTLQGNTFNSANQLVKLDGSGDLPSDSVGSPQITDASVALDDINLTSVDTHYVTTNTVQTINSAKTFSSTVTMSGRINADGELIIPNAADPNIDNIGELGFDNTDNTLIAYDGSAERVIAHDIYQITFTIFDDGDWNNEVVPLWNAPKDMAVTIVRVDATVLGSSTPQVTYNIEERAFGSMGSAGTDIYSSDQAADANGENETSFSNAGIAAGAHLVFTTAGSAESGTVDAFSATIYYRKNVE